jgi:predicted kinase
MTTLHIMVGPAGCGKSTYASKLQRSNGVETIIISSDQLREVICTDVNDMSKNHIVFSNVRYMTEYFLKQGYDVIIDATNLTKSVRKDYIEIARKLQCNVSAHVLQTTMEETLKRNNSRNRVVPEEVIIKMFKKLEVPTKEEVDEIIWVSE